MGVSSVVCEPRLDMRNEITYHSSINEPTQHPLSLSEAERINDTLFPQLALGFNTFTIHPLEPTCIPQGEMQHVKI